ncbi:MAG: ATP-binding protein [Saprospiraceae bacterium]
MRSPFKFLDPFQQSDAKEFFGRDEEIALLYDFVNKNRLVVVYGTSGTGKTSVVQCGLSSRFDSTDWFPLFIRRGHNINDSLREALLKNDAAIASSVSIPEMVARLNSRYLRPVYLIFDQLEELLILGKEAEQKAFIASVKGLLQDEDLDCHIIFILREEFLARLYDFEKEIPTLFDRRLRVEPMGQGKLREVIQRSTSQFNIHLEDPQANAGQMIASLSAGKSGISLPYLQVYLDMLWREDYLRTYPQADPEALEAALDKKQYPKLDFTTAEIVAFGKIEDVLARFLAQQTDLIQKQMLTEGVATPDIVKQVLDSFVTGEGTKQPVPYTTQQEAILLDHRAPEDLRKLPVPLATRVLRLLEKSRILRFTEDSIELAHDSLAALIDQQRSDAQRRLNELHNRLKNNYREYQDNKEFLTRKQLTVLEEYLPLLKPRLDQPILDFIAASGEDAKRKEQAARRKSRIVVIVLATLTGISIVGLIMAQLAKIEARNALRTANAELTKREQLEIVDYLQKGEAYRNSRDFDLAQDLYEFLRDSMFAKEAHKHHAAKDEVEKAIQACIDSLNKNEKK